MDKKRINISHTKIFTYWKDKAITESGDVIQICDINSSDMPVIENDNQPCCWACGCMAYSDSKDIPDKPLVDLYNTAKSKSLLNRCHIVPFAMDRNDDLSNLFLLCEKCHRESPDTDNPKNFFRWVYEKKHHLIVQGHDLNSLLKKIKDECEKQHKDPFSGDFSKMSINSHGASYSDSSIVYGYVDTCNPL